MFVLKRVASSTPLVNSVLGRRLFELPIRTCTQRRLVSRTRATPAVMKRKEAPSTAEKATAKRPKVEVPEYHATPQVKDEYGSIQWPAPNAQLERAREIILEW